MCSRPAPPGQSSPGEQTQCRRRGPTTSYARSAKVPAIHPHQQSRSRLRCHASRRGSPIRVWHFAGTTDFWVQSMQNWQSEFLAVAAPVAA
ncbi:DUF6766 family protein [Hamadaea flava]|uniref:DUF6766 family protein n=1 Tax=Hamadaea flava TaxID=1742688 RepID=A0ABV8LM97_9ACTN|nr:DUF6766 family protein [Hamadaea flava]